MITNPFTQQTLNLKKGTESLIKGFKQMNSHLRDAAEARHHRKAGLEPWKLPEIRQKKAEAIRKERAQPLKTIAKKYKS
jgi:hypothetical protein